MEQYTTIAFIIYYAWGVLGCQQPTLESCFQDPPYATIEPTIREFPRFGFSFTDNYFWLRNKTDSRVKSYIDKENEYTSAVLSKYENVAQEIYDEFIKYTPVDEDPATKIGDYLYYSKSVPDKA